MSSIRLIAKSAMRRTLRLDDLPKRVVRTAFGMLRRGNGLRPPRISLIWRVVCQGEQLGVARWRWAAGACVGWVGGGPVLCATRVRLICADLVAAGPLFVVGCRCLVPG